MVAGTWPAIFSDELVLKGLPRRADGISILSPRAEARGSRSRRSNTVEFSKTALLAGEKKPPTRAGGLTQRTSGSYPMLSRGAPVIVGTGT
jgi:hypothetical protein